MNWQVMTDTLEKWVKQNADIPVVWSTEAAENHKPPVAQLKISAFQQIGEDEKRAELDEDATDGRDLMYTVTGQRRFTLGCKIRSRDNRPGYAAIAYAEKLRNSLIKPTTIVLFQSAEISVHQAEATVDLSNIFQDREESIAVLDIHMGTVVNESSEREFATYINTVEVTSNVIDTSGESIDSSLQWDEEEIP